MHVCCLPMRALCDYVLFTHVLVCACLCMCIRLFKYVCVRAHAVISLRVHVYLYVCVRLHMYSCVDVLGVWLFYVCAWFRVDVCV